MNRRLGKLRALSPQDRLLLLRAWGLLAGVEIGLRLGRFRRLESWSQGGAAPGTGQPSAADCEAVSRLQWLTGTAARLQPLPTRCLGRSLVLRRLLAERGRPSELKIGVRREGSELEAHAWVELDGRSLDAEQAASERFAPLHPRRPTGEEERTPPEPEAPAGSGARR